MGCPQLSGFRLRVCPVLLHLSSSTNIAMSAAGGSEVLGLAQKMVPNLSGRGTLLNDTKKFYRYQTCPAERHTKVICSYSAHALKLLTSPNVLCWYMLFFIGFRMYK